MQIFKAVLFDIDGTLLDTSEFIFQAYEHTLATFGYPQSGRSDISKLIGKSLESCYRALTGSDEVENLCEAHRRFQAEHLDLSRPYPKAPDTLRALTDAGIKLAAVTTRARETSIKTLKLAGLLGYLDYVVALEDVENLKPHPEPLLRALGHLEVAPEEAAMVGDTDVDILAGRSAGLVTIGVTYGFHGTSIVQSNPDYTVDDIDEVLPLLLPLLGSRR